MLKKSIARLDDFSGGFVTKGSELSLKPSQSPNCQNVHSDIFKSLQKRNGYTKLITNGISGGTAYGVYNYVRDDTTQFLMSLWSVSSAAALKRTSDAGTAWTATAPTAITAHANLGTALTDAKFAHFTSYSTDCIITTEGRDVPQKHDSADTYPTLTTNYVDIDWENSHCFVTGNVSVVTPDPLITKSYLKITIDGTAFDDVDCDGDTSIADVAASINAHSGFAAKGFAWVDSDGYLRICSNTRGSTGSVVVADGSNDDQECTEILFDGVTATGTTITANIAPSGKYCIVWHDYTWIANTSTYPDALYYSASANHISWTSTDYVDIVTPGDVGITGIAILRGRMYVFKKHSIHRVTYLGGTPLFDIKEVASNVGTSSPRSISNVEIPGEGEVISYLGTDLQWYILDGYNSTPISENISTYNSISTFCMIGDGTTYGINPAQLTKVHSVNYLRKHWIVLFFCKDNDTTPKDAFVYDYYSKSFWPFHFDQDGTDVFHVSCISDDANGQLKAYVAGATHLWLFDNGNNDDAGNIDAFWISPRMDMGSEVSKKDLRNITLTTSSSAATPTFEYRTGWSATYATASTLVASTQEHTYNIPRFEELLQIRFRDDSTSVAFELIRASVIAQVRGQAK